MRVLFISNYSLLYGANKSMLSVVKHLKAKTHEVKVLLPSHGPIENELKENGIDYSVIRFYPTFLYVKFLFKYLSLPLVAIFNLLKFPILKAHIKLYNPDVIYSNTSAENVGVFISKMLGIKHVVHVREFMSKDHGAYFLFGKRLKRLFLGLSDGVIYVSEAVKAHVNQNRPLDPRTHKVIYNGISISSLGRLPIWDAGSKVIRLGSVGVLQVSKGHHVAIEYVNELVKLNIDIELHIWGKGQFFYERRLKRAVKRYRLENHVIFHGFEFDVRKIYTKIDALCVFSRSEGFGRVTVESMLMGRPVLGYNNAGTIELIDHGKTGFLFKNFDEFKVSLDNLFADKAKYMEFSHNCIDVASSKFSERQYVRSVEAFLLNFVNS